MMEEFSEESLRKNCLHCDPSCWVFEYLIESSTYFHIICDPNPLIERHLLIIPRRHVSCLGEYTQEEYREFKQIYTKASDWILKEYGSIATFEHGKIGQTVFHSHIHLIPFSGEIDEVVPEEGRLHPIYNMNALFDTFQKGGQYLFVSIGDKMWTVDTSLEAPRFFRDRFAKAFNKPERGNSLLLKDWQKGNIRCQKDKKDP